MDTRPNAMFFAGFILFNGFLISCNGAELSRTKRTVELIEGAKDFILRMAEINATPGRLVWVQINDENYEGYGAEDVFIPEDTISTIVTVKEEEPKTEKPHVTIVTTKEEHTTEKLIEVATLTPPPPPPHITDFYPPPKPSDYDVKPTVPATTEPAPEDKKQGLLTSLFSFIFPPKPKTKKKEKKEEKKPETTTETVTVFIPDDRTTTERHYLPPPAPTTTPRPTTTTTQPPSPVHVHHIIQPIHIPHRLPIPQPVHHPVQVHQPVQVHHPVKVAQGLQVHHPVQVAHHLPQSPIELVGLQPLSTLPVCTSSPVTVFQRCLPASLAQHQLVQQPLAQHQLVQQPSLAQHQLVQQPALLPAPLPQPTILQQPVLNTGLVRLPRNIDQANVAPVVEGYLQEADYTDSTEEEEDYSDLIDDLEYFY